MKAGDSSPVPGYDATRISYPFMIAWLLLGIGLNFLDRDAAAAGVSILGIVHSAIGFLAHGGRRISAPGIYMLGTGLFGFFSGLYLVTDPIFGDLPYLLAAVNILYFGQILVYYLSWKPTDRIAPPISRDVDPRTVAWGRWVGFILMAGSIGLSILGNYDPMVDAAAFTGIILFAVAAFRDPSRKARYAYIVTGLGVVGYSTYVFNGFGRLTLGALGVAVVATFAHRWRGSLMKVSLVAALGPGLMYLAQNRVDFSASRNPSSTETGMESVVGPLGRFAQLLGMDALGDIFYMWGSSFVTSAFVLVPRQLWPGKPIGFGAELAMLFRPDLDGYGHSELALFAGEWLFNFGLAGVLAGIPIVGWAVNWLDRKWIAINGAPMTDRRELLAAVALTIVGAGLLDLAWGGTFTFAARAGTRLVIVLAVFVLLAWRKREVGHAKPPKPTESARLKLQQVEPP
jgi:hypothetical protein